MPCTDLTQPINRKEAREIIEETAAISERLRKLIARAQGNGHDDAPDHMDDALCLLSSAIDSVNDELDNARKNAA